MSRDESKKKALKIKKNKKTTEVRLLQSDVEMLKTRTNYSEEEIRLWFKGFKEDCPQGYLGKEKVMEMYAMILPKGNAKVFVEQIFRMFDKDENGHIDFKVTFERYRFFPLNPLHCVRNF